MRLYFLSCQPCILRVGGAYFGQVGDFEKFADVSLQDGLFAEFIPQGALPVCFFLNESLLFSPPDGVELYLTERGAALYITHFPPIDFSLKLIAQAKTQTALITLFQQGETQAVVERGQELFCATLQGDFSNSEIEEINGVFLIKTPTHLCALNEKAEILLSTPYHAFTKTDDGFSLICPLSDSLGRNAKKTYRVEQGKLTLQDYALLAPQGEDHGLIAYAFFESVLIGGDYVAFLSDELKEKARSLTEFLGEYLSVVLTDDEKRIGLVKKRRERVFDVVYYTVELEKGKIVDIHT